MCLCVCVCVCVPCLCMCVVCVVSFAHTTSAGTKSSEQNETSECAVVFTIVVVVLGVVHPTYPDRK